jgi:LysM repeat protein
MAKRAVLAAVLLASGAAEARTSHRVSEGESLWIISQKYGCSLDDLRAANEIEDNTIYPGRDLELPASCRELPAAAPQTLRRDETVEPAAAETAASDPSLNAVTSERGAIQNALVRYRVARGDTLVELAGRYGTSVLAIQAQNGLPDHLIMIGQIIEIPAHSRGSLEWDILGPVRTIVGQSIGRPAAGQLRKATELPALPLYHRRRPHMMFGTLHLVEHVQRVVRIVSARHPKVHKLAIGDLSARGGGKVPRHASHQTGRDVDLGFYFKRKPRGYPEDFVTATAATLDFPATWTMIKTLADTAEEDGGVYMMFLDYDVQKMLYDWARERGVARGVLSWMFQYPRGRHSLTGLIRHEPAHAAHVHVRFQCPAGDGDCR